MARGDADLRVVVSGDTRALDRSLRTAETRLQKFGKNVSLAGGAKGGLGGIGSAAALKAGGGALAAGIVAKQVSSLAGAASDLHEQISKSRAVFGASSGEVEEWSKTTAEAIGVSRTAALEATGTFGNLFNSVGITGDAASGMSRDLVKLGADLASFNNASPEETLAAIRSGLVGEAEPLRRYGVLLSEARVQQVALADTGKRTVASLTQQDKAAARYKIILQDTKKAQGDFARTSEGLANQQRILKARLADTRAELGEKLLPFMVKATEAANKFVGAFQTATAAVSTFNSQDFRQDFADAFGMDALIDALNKVAPQLKAEREKFFKSLEFQLPSKPGGSGGPVPFGQPGFKPGKTGIPVTKVSTRLEGEELDARLGGNRNTLKGVLSKEAAFLRSALKDARLTPAQENALKQALLGVTDEIKAIDEQIIADADEKRRAAQDAKNKMKASNQKAAAALKAQAQAFADQGNDIKSAALASFDTKTQKIDNARNLKTAQDALAQARQLGGPEAIRLAEQGLFDANRAIARQTLADTPFTVRDGPKGPTDTLTVGNVTININGNQSPEQIAKQVIAVINRQGKRTASSTSGRLPGHHVV